MSTVKVIVKILLKSKSLSEKNTNYITVTLNSFYFLLLRIPFYRVLWYVNSNKICTLYKRQSFLVFADIILYLSK